MVADRLRAAYDASCHLLGLGHQRVAIIKDQLRSGIITHISVFKVRRSLAEKNRTAAEGENNRAQSLNVPAQRRYYE